jgi:hypothetical protein
VGNRTPPPPRTMPRSAPPRRRPAGGGGGVARSSASPGSSTSVVRRPLRPVVRPDDSRTGSAALLDEVLPAGGPASRRPPPTSRRRPYARRGCARAGRLITHGHRQQVRGAWPALGVRELADEYDWPLPGDAVPPRARCPPWPSTARACSWAWRWSSTVACSASSTLTPPRCWRRPTGDDADPSCWPSSPTSSMGPPPVVQVPGPTRAGPVVRGPPSRMWTRPARRGPVGRPTRHTMHGESRRPGCRRRRAQRPPADRLDREAAFGCRRRSLPPLRGAAFLVVVDRLAAAMVGAFVALRRRPLGGAAAFGAGCLAAERRKVSCAPRRWSSSARGRRPAGQPRRRRPDDDGRLAPPLAGTTGGQSHRARRGPGCRRTRRPGRPPDRGDRGRGGSTTARPWSRSCGGAGPS